MPKIVKHLSKKNFKPQQKGGAIYTFNLDDKIGGLPAYVPLNGTRDGDCPATDTKDLGFTNYGISKGGARKHHSKKHSKKHGKMHRSKMHHSKKHGKKHHSKKTHRSKSHKKH